MALAVNTNRVNLCSLDVTVFCTILLVHIHILVQLLLLYCNCVMNLLFTLIFLIPICLRTSDIISKFRIIAMFYNLYLHTTFHMKCVRNFVVHLSKEFNVLNLPISYHTRPKTSEKLSMPCYVLSYNMLT